MKVRVVGSFAAVLSVFVLILAGCPNPALSPTGSLTVTFADNVNPKTLTPSISMDVANYTVSGTGPGNATFSQSTGGGTATIDKLAFGQWTVTVSAFNAGSTLIGQGTKTVLVHTGATATVSISVVPLVGNGTLDLTVTWPAADVETPSISASLVPSGGSPLTFSMGDGTATLSSATVPAGYRTLVLQLLDNGIPVMGAVEVVRIAANAGTSGTYAFSHVNKPGGTITVNILPALGNPIPVTITGVSSKHGSGTPLTVTASAGDATPDVTWVWYLNGASIGTGATLTFGSNLPVGYYRLDATGFTSDGTRAGSASAEFVVVAQQVIIQLASVIPIAGAGDGIQQRYPELAVDPTGVVSVTYTESVFPNQGYLVSSADNFATRVALGPATQGNGEGVHIALDRTTGVMHALAPRFGDGFGYDSFHATAQDWSSWTRVTSLDNLAGRHEMYGTLAVTGGAAHSLWRMYNQDDGRPLGYCIQYSTSADWYAWEYVRAPLYGTLTEWGPTVDAPLMALDDAGVVHALWSDSAAGHHLLYANSSAYTVVQDPDPMAAPGSARRVWTPRQLPLTEDHAYPNYDVAAGGGTVYAVQADGDVRVYSSTDGGASWLQAAQLHLEGVHLDTVFAVYRDGALRLGVQGFDTSSDFYLAYVNSSDWALRSITLKGPYSPRIGSGFTRQFDYRNGKAYFTWADQEPPAYDGVIVLAVANVGP